MGLISCKKKTNKTFQHLKKGWNKMIQIFETVTEQML